MCVCVFAGGGAVVGGWGGAGYGVTVPRSQNSFADTGTWRSDVTNVS